MTSSNPYFNFFGVDNDDSLAFHLYKAYKEMREVYTDTGIVTLQVA